MCDLYVSLKACYMATQRGMCVPLQSVQLIMDQLLLERPGVNHTTLPPQGVGGSDRSRSWAGFWALNTGF